MFKQVLLALTAGLSLSAWSADFSIGTLSLTLGSDKAVVMKDAASRYKVLTVEGNGDLFFLYDLRTGAVAGAVTFSNGKLVQAIRKWGEQLQQQTPERS